MLFKKKNKQFKGWRRLSPSSHHCKCDAKSGVATPIVSAASFKATTIHKSSDQSEMWNPVTAKIYFY